MMATRRSHRLVDTASRCSQRLQGTVERLRFSVRQEPVEVVNHDEPVGELRHTCHGPPQRRDGYRVVDLGRIHLRETADRVDVEREATIIGRREDEAIVRIDRLWRESEMRAEVEDAA